MVPLVAVAIGAVITASGLRRRSGGEPVARPVGVAGAGAPDAGPAVAERFDEVVDVESARPVRGDEVLADVDADRR